MGFFLPGSALIVGFQGYIHGKVRAELAIHLPDDSSQ